MNYISTTSIIKRAWATVKANLLSFVAAAAILFVIQVILNSITTGDKDAPMSPEMGILSLLSTAISLIIGVAVTVALIRIARGAPVTTQALSFSSSQVLRFIGVNILFGLIMLAIVIPVVGAGFALGIASFVGNIDNNILVFVAIVLAALLCIIYVSIRLMFAKYIVLDGATGVVAAIKQSWNLTSGNIWTIVKLGLLSLLVALLGTIALLVGLLVAVPVVALAYAYLYVELSAQKEKVIAEVKNNE